MRDTLTRVQMYRIKRGRPADSRVTPAQLYKWFLTLTGLCETHLYIQTSRSGTKYIEIKETNIKIRLANHTCDRYSEDITHFWNEPNLNGFSSFCKQIKSTVLLTNNIKVN